jgi:hypothetical protein
MIFIVLALLFSLVIAAAIVVYVAFPHRGEEVPRAAWLGRAMRRGVEALPTLDEEETTSGSVLRR